MHYAAFGRKPDVMEYLLSTSDPKLDVNSTNAKKCSVLHVSVVMQDIKAVELLLRQPNILVSKLIHLGEYLEFPNVFLLPRQKSDILFLIFVIR